MKPKRGSEQRHLKGPVPVPLEIAKRPEIQRKFKMDRTMLQKFMRKLGLFGATGNDALGNLLEKIFYPDMRSVCKLFCFGIMEIIAGGYCLKVLLLFLIELMTEA